MACVLKARPALSPSRAGFARATADAGLDASYPHDPRWIAWNRGGAACSRRAEGRWALCWPKADCSASMRAAGIAGVSRRRSAPITTRQATDRHPASDLVRRNFMAERGRTSCGWPTSPSCPRWPGFVYLAVVLDARVAPDHRMGLLGRSEDPRRARRSRHGAQRPESLTNVVHHSDRGSANTRRSLSALAARKSAFVHRQAWSATPTTMRCATASLPH